MRWRHLILSASLLVTAACSGDSDGASSTTAEVDQTSADAATTSSMTPRVSTTTAPKTSTTVASTTSTAATAASLQPVAQSLIDQYDTAVAAILADPRVASDPNNAAVKAYLALFSDGSSFALGTVEFWAEQGAAGRFYRPGLAGTMFSSKVVAVEVKSPTEALAKACATTSMQVVDAGGQPIESQAGVTGVEVVLVLVGDRWLLRDLTEVAPEGCPRPGSGP